MSTLSCPPFLLTCTLLLLDVASTSPPNSRGFVSTSVSSSNSAITDYEVEVVEIRVQEGELKNIIPWVFFTALIHLPPIIIIIVLVCHPSFIIIFLYQVFSSRMFRYLLSPYTHCIYLQRSTSLFFSLPYLHYVSFPAIFHSPLPLIQAKLRYIVVASFDKFMINVDEVFVLSGWIFFFHLEPETWYLAAIFILPWTMCYLNWFLVSSHNYDENTHQFDTSSKSQRSCTKSTAQTSESMIWME